MKLFLVVYDVDFEAEVMEALRASGVASYTLWERVLGVGERSEPKLSTHAWPSFNRALMVVVGEERAKDLMEHIKPLCLRPQGGIRAYFWEVEEVR